MKRDRRGGGEGDAGKGRLEIKKRVSGVWKEVKEPTGRERTRGEMGTMGKGQRGRSEERKGREGSRQARREGNIGIVRDWDKGV